MPKHREHNFWGTIPTHTVFPVSSAYVELKQNIFICEKAFPATSSSQGVIMITESHVRSHTLFKQTGMKSLLVTTFLLFQVSSWMPAVHLPLHRSTQLLVTHSCSRAEPFSLGSPALNSHLQVLTPHRHTYKKALGGESDREGMKTCEDFFQTAREKPRAGVMWVAPPDGNYS